MLSNDSSSSYRSVMIARSREGSVASAERASLASDARSALATLPSRDRAIITLRYDEDESFESIARIMKIPANTVRSLHHRALAVLRNLLEARH